MSQQNSSSEKPAGQVEELKKIEEPAKKIKEPFPKGKQPENDEDFNPDSSGSDEEIEEDGIQSSDHSSIDLKEYLKYREEHENNDDSNESEEEEKEEKKQSKNSKKSEKNEKVDPKIEEKKK